MEIPGTGQGKTWIIEAGDGMGKRLFRNPIKGEMCSNGRG